MALRVLLVSLVASMGFELPSGQDVQSWTNRGSEWVNARVANLSSLQVEAERAFVGAPESVQTAETSPSTPREVASLRDDLTFDAVVEGMATNFVADLASMEVAKPATELASIEEAKPIGPAVALVEPSNEIPQTPCLDPDVEVLENDLIASEIPGTSPVITVEATPTEDKLSSAVRLTREAVNAWASLIQPTTEPAAVPEQVDSF